MRAGSIAGRSEASSTDRRPAEWPFVGVALAFAVLVYHSIVRNYFFADDFLNLYHIANKSLLEYLLTPNGGHLLVARNAIFYLMARLFGTEPAYYYWSSLLTHLVNVYLLYRLLRIVTESPWLATFGAALWGGSPFIEEALGWYAVYGHVVVATTLLVILCQATDDAARGVPPTRTQLRLWYLLALIAATSFGTGIGLAMALPFALALLLPVREMRRPPLVSLVAVVPFAYVLLTLAYERLSGLRPVTAAGVLSLVQDRTAVLVFLARLIGVGLTRLVLGFYSGPGADLTVWYAAVGLLAAGVLVGYWASPRLVRGQLAAWSLLLIACYGMIAVGRALFLSKLPDDVIGKLTRYHYVGQLLLTIILCTLLSRLPSPGRAWAKSGLLAAWFAAAIFAYARYAPPVDHHDGARAQTAQAIAVMRAAIDAQPIGGTVRITNQTFEPLPLPPVMFPGWAAAFTIFFPDNTVDGRRVYFVESNPGVVRAMEGRGRMDALLVPP